MQLRQLKVQNFRGIKELDWTVGGTTVCLIGPGDSTKTTVLDAIELVLSPRWNVPFSDVDFHNADTSQPITITATVGDLPSDLIREDKFGLYLCGWKDGAGPQPDPEDDSEKVLCIRMLVTSDLEPEWEIFKESTGSAQKIGWRDRAKFGVARLGVEIDRDLAWGRGSALFRLTGENTTEVSRLPDVHRILRQGFKQQNQSVLNTQAQAVRKEAVRLGAYTTGDYTAGLDATSVSLSTGAITLHDNDIPLHAKGLGTRRLAALAAQKLMVPEGAILLIDEIEHALEPHRVRRILNALKQHAAKDDGQTAASPRTARGQIIMTTHSAVAVHALSVTDLNVARCSAGRTTIVMIPVDLTKTVYKAPEALLSRKVVVCEGATEQGFLCVYDEWRNTKSDTQPFATLGATLVDGGGNDAPKIARELSSLGYDVMYFGDSDKFEKDATAKMTDAGVAVVVWPGQASTEKRIVEDIACDSLKGLIDLAGEISDSGMSGILESLGRKLPGGVALTTSDTKAWGVSDAEARKAIWSTAGPKKWFKTYDKAQRLAWYVCPLLSDIPGSELMKTLVQIEAWVHAD